MFDWSNFVGLGSLSRGLLGMNLSENRMTNNVDNFIEEESKRYKDPDQSKKWIEGQPQQLEQFRMIVLEEQLVEKLKNALKSKKKVIKFSELANK